MHHAGGTRLIGILVALMVLVACSVNGESSSTTQGTQIALQTTQISMQGTQVALAQIQATLPPTATPNLPSDIIFKKYSEIGGEIVLGKARGNAQPFPDTDGWFQAFANGTIYWSPRTQSHLILGAIQERWRSPVEGHRLGFPTSDEISTIDGHGKFQEFEHGDIYWSQQTGAHIVVGAILQEWMRLGKEASWLGYPISDEEDADGEWKRLTRFQHGVIKWSAEKGVVALPTAASTICPPVGATKGRIISQYESVTGHSQNAADSGSGFWGDEVGVWQQWGVPETPRVGTVRAGDGVWLLERTTDGAHIVTQGCSIDGWVQTGVVISPP